MEHTLKPQHERGDSWHDITIASGSLHYPFWRIIKQLQHWGFELDQCNWALCGSGGTTRGLQRLFFWTGQLSFLGTPSTLRLGMCRTPKRGWRCNNTKVLSLTCMDLTRRDLGCGLAFSIFDGEAVLVFFNLQRRCQSYQQCTVMDLVGCLKMRVERKVWRLDCHMNRVQQERERERAARKACCSTSSLVSHSCWLMTWVKGMNIPCASGNCRMAACFALTRTGRWQRACKGWKGKKRRSMLKSGYLPTIIFCSVVHSGSWFLLLFWWNVLRFPQRLPSFSEDSSHLQIDSTSWHDICHTPGNPKTRHPCSDYWGESHTTGSPKWASSSTLAAGA